MFVEELGEGAMNFAITAFSEVRGRKGGARPLD
jgi:hypothetical protein